MVSCGKNRARPRGRSRGKGRGGRGEPYPRAGCEGGGGELVARVHREGEVLKERHTEEGTELSARVRPDLAGVLEKFAVNGSRA